MVQFAWKAFEDAPPGPSTHLGHRLGPRLLFKLPTERNPNLDKSDVSDMKRAVSFYRDVLGLPLKFESPGWTEFATEGAALALHASEGTRVREENPLKVPAGQCRPGLSVPNLDEFHIRMVEYKVPCIQEPTEIFGARIAQYLDPDGLAISVGEERRGSEQ